MTLLSTILLKRYPLPNLFSQYLLGSDCNDFLGAIGKYRTSRTLIDQAVAAEQCFLT